MTAFLARIAAVLLVCFPVTTIAAHPRVAQAQRAWDELRFEDVLAEVAAARREGTLAREDDIALTRLEASTYAVYDDAPQAVEAFRRLLALEPGFTLGPETSPKLRRYLAAARAARAPAPPPRAYLPRCPPPPRQRPMYASGWFWAAVAAALSVGLGAGLLLGNDDAAGAPAAP